MSASRWPRTRYALMSSRTRACLAMSSPSAVVGERAVDLPAQGAERDPEIREDAVVEAVLAEKELLDAREETPRIPRPG